MASVSPPVIPLVRAPHKPTYSSAFMLDAAIKALTQMFTPPFRAVLLKSIGLAILVLDPDGRRIAPAVRPGFPHEGPATCKALPGSGLQTPLHVLLWMLAIMAGLGLDGGRDFHHAGRDGIRGKLLLRRDRRAGRACALSGRSARPSRFRWGRAPRIEGVKTALLALLVYLVRGAVSAVRRARAADLLRRDRLSARPRILPARRDALPFGRAGQASCASCTTTRIFTAGLFIAAFVSIPILNLATPLFGTALHGAHAQEAWWARGAS